MLPTVEVWSLSLWTGREVCLPFDSVHFSVFSAFTMVGNHHLHWYQNLITPWTHLGDPLSEPGGHTCLRPYAPCSLL